jgi:hypothetical protein
MRHWISCAGVRGTLRLFSGEVPDMPMDALSEAERRQIVESSLRTFMRLPVAQRSSVALMGWASPRRRRYLHPCRERDFPEAPKIAPTPSFLPDRRSRAMTLRLRSALRIGALAVAAALLLTTAGLGPATAADVLEDGVSGQIPLLDQIDGKSALGYHRGLAVVGRNPILDRGANFAMAWVGQCAYVTTTSAQQLAGALNTPYLIPTNNPLNGLAVIDVSNPAQPQLVNILQSPAMLDPHESLQGNDARHIVLATSSMGNLLDVYDASDCRHPVLKSTLHIGVGLDNALGTQGITYRGHAMCVSPDGTMAYATGTPFNNAAIDLTVLSHPIVKQLFVPAAHDCDVSPDGNRLYLAVYGGAAFGTGGLLLSTTSILDTNDHDLPPYGTSNFNGLMILDSSQFEKHEANARFTIVSELPWTPESEGENPLAGSHTARYFRNHGRTFLYSSDEWPTIAACPWAHGRIIDITNERAPVKIVDITLGVQQIANCASTVPDLANYSAHYGGIDNQSNASLLFTTEYAGGLRVYDIRNPYAPVEIAYEHPAPILGEPLSIGSQIFGSRGSGWEAVPTYIHYVPKTGDIWMVGFTTGFSVLHLTNTAGPSVLDKVRFKTRRR